MIHRIIPLGAHPLQVLNHIRAAGCFMRLETTDWRGSVALVGDGQVQAVGELREVKPATRGKPKDGKEAPQGYLWCFAGLADVEGVACADSGERAMFENGDRLEPQFLPAGAQDELNRALGLEAAEIPFSTRSFVMGMPEPKALDDDDETEISREMERSAPAMPPDYQMDVPKKAGRTGKAGQMEMF